MNDNNDQNCFSKTQWDSSKKSTDFKKGNTVLLATRNVWIVYLIKYELLQPGQIIYVYLYLQPIVNKSQEDY